MKGVGYKLKEEKQLTVTDSMDRKEEVSRHLSLNVLLCVWLVQEWFIVKPNSFKYLTRVKSKTSQFEIIVKLLGSMF